MTVTKFFTGVAAFAIASTLAAPASAQDQGEPGVTAEGPEETVFDGDYLSVGVGVGVGAGVGDAVAGVADGDADVGVGAGDGELDGRPAVAKGVVDEGVDGVLARVHVQLLPLPCRRRQQQCLALLKSPTRIPSWHPPPPSVLTPVTSSS